MTNPIWSFITALIQPLADTVDAVHTSDEERLAIREQIAAIQAGVTMKMIDYERELLSARAQVIMAEAQGQSWLQRTWRPITMLSFLALVVLDAFGLLPFRLAPEAWTLLQFGLTGYVVGRSAEKVAGVWRSTNKRGDDGSE